MKRKNMDDNLTDLVERVGANSIIVFVTKIISLILNLLFIVIVARKLGEKLFGVFSFGIAYVLIFSIISNFGLTPIIVRELSKNKEKQEVLFANAIFAKGLLTITTLILLWVSILIFQFEYQNNLTIFILSFIIIFSSKITGFRSVFETPYQATLKMFIPSILQIIDSLLAIIILLFLKNSTTGIILIAIIYVFSNFPGFLLLIKNSFFTVLPKWNISKYILIDLFKESYPLAIYVAGITLYRSIDIFLIKYFLRYEDLGWFSAANRLITPLNFIPMAIVSSFFPIMSKYSLDIEKIKKYCSSGLKVLIFISIFIALVVLVKGKEIILLLYGANFIPSIVPFKILIFSIIFNFVNFYLVDFNTATNNQKKNIIIVICLLLFSLIFNILLIPVLEIQGASYARLVANGISAILIIIMNIKYLDKKAIQDITKLTVVGFILSLIIISIKMYNLSMLIFVIVTFLLLTYLLNIFNQNEITFLKNQFNQPIFGGITK